jgi:hypothetical protein
MDRYGDSSGDVGKKDLRLEQRLRKLVFGQRPSMLFVRRTWCDVVSVAGRGDVERSISRVRGQMERLLQRKEELGVERF